MIELAYPQTPEENLGLTKWLQDRIPDMAFGPQTRCIAFFEPGVGIKAVVAFYNYRGTGLEISFASDGPWARRDLMAQAMRYPFAIGCHRVSALVRKDNKKVRKLLDQLGFKQEGKLRRAAEDGSDLFLYGLLEHEFRFWPKGMKLRKAA